MKFRFRHFAFFIYYCICALIVFISLIIYWYFALNYGCGSAYEKDITSIPIREAEKPVEYKDPISTLIDISEHIIDVDTLEDSMICEDPIHSIDINTLENPTEFKGSMILPIIRKEQELEIDIPNIEKKV